MRTILAALMLVSAPALAGAPPKGGPFGLGIGGGYLVNGVSAKYYLSERLAVQGVVGSWGFNTIALGGSVLFPQPNLYESPDFLVAWNFGAGGGVGLAGSSTLFIVNGVAGIELEVVELPLEFVLEWRPGVATANWRNNGGTTNGVGLVLWNAGLHIRYFFPR